LQLSLLVLHPPTQKLFRDFHKILQKIHHPKNDIPQSIFARQSTTTCPQKHHTQTPFFPKNPSKNADSPHKKITAAK